MALYPGLAEDGNFGPVTRKALQTLLWAWGYYNREIDGVFGKWSIIALQNMLHSQGPISNFYNGRIDGIAGDMTWDGLGNFLAFSGYWSGFGRYQPWPKGKTPYNWSGFTRQIQVWLNAAR